MYPPITATQEFDITLTPMTAPPRPRPAPLDGAPVWASSDESQAVVVPIPGTLQATVKGVAPSVGGATYTITATGDADLGAGVRALVYQDSGSVTIGEAVTMGAEIGPVREQP